MKQQETDDWEGKGNKYKRNKKKEKRKKGERESENSDGEMDDLKDNHFFKGEKGKRSRGKEKLYILIKMYDNQGTVEEEEKVEEWFY